MSYMESLRTGANAMKSNISMIGNTASFLADRSSGDADFEFKNIMNDFSVSARADESPAEYSSGAVNQRNDSQPKPVDDHEQHRTEKKHEDNSDSGEEKHVSEETQCTKEETAKKDSEVKNTLEKNDKIQVNDLSLAEILASKVVRIDIPGKTSAEKTGLISLKDTAADAKKSGSAAAVKSSETEGKNKKDKAESSHVDHAAQTTQKAVSGEASAASKTVASGKTAQETAVKASAEQTTATTLKANPGNQGLSFDMENAGIRFTKVSVSGTTAGNEQSNANGLELLKNLAGRQSVYAATGTAHAKSKKETVSPEDADQILTTDSKSKAGVKTAAQNTVISESVKSSEKTSVKKEFSDSRDGMKNSSNGENGRGILNFADTGSASSPLNIVRGGTSQTFNQSSMGQLMDVVNNIANQVQTALKGEGIERKQQLSLEVQSDELGSISISIKKAGETLSINLQMDNDSAKQQLDGQKDELGKQLKELGFSNVDIEVGLNDKNAGGNGRGGEAAKSNADSVENVKLAGNAEADLSQILAMQ